MPQAKKLLISGAYFPLCRYRWVRGFESESDNFFENSNVQLQIMYDCVLEYVNTNKILL